MDIRAYHIDAFTNSLFHGNPAMVCLLPSWLPDSVLQTLAAEINLPATAFMVRDNNTFQVRWFAPEYEIALCGHGSLACGFVIFNILEPTLKEVTLLHPNVGELKIARRDDDILLDFPVKSFEPIVTATELVNGLGLPPRNVFAYKNERLIAVYDSEKEIVSLQPNMSILKQLDYLGIIVTAPGEQCDFVSRVFYPKKATSEDAVTGSSYCFLAPYWAQQLHKNNFQTRQLSKRGGEVRCDIMQNRIVLHGKAVLFMQGSISIKS